MTEHFTQILNRQGRWLPVKEELQRVHSEIETVKAEVKQVRYNNMYWNHRKLSRKWMQMWRDPDSENKNKRLYSWQYKNLAPHKNLYKQRSTSHTTSTLNDSAPGVTNETFQEQTHNITHLKVKVHLYHQTSSPIENELFLPIIIVFLEMTIQSILGIPSPLLSFTGSLAYQSLWNDRWTSWRRDSMIENMLMNSFTQRWTKYS